MKRIVFSYIFSLVFICGCSNSEFETSRYLFNRVVPILEDSNHVILSADEMLMLDDSRAVITQFLSGKPLVVDIESGIITNAIVTDEALVDSVAANSISMWKDTPFEQLGIAEAASNPSFGMEGGQFPKYRFPQHSHILGVFGDTLKFLTRADVPGLRRNDGGSIWLTVVGVTSISKVDFRLFNFRSLAISGGLYPQFVYITPDGTGGQWASMFDFPTLEKRKYDSLPFAGRFDSNGSFTGELVYLSEETARRDGYFTLLNPLVRVGETKLLMVNAKSGAIDVGDLIDKRKTTRYEGVPSDGVRTFGVDTISRYGGVVKTSATTIEVVASWFNKEKTDSRFRVLEYKLDPTSTRPTLARVMTPDSGVKIGPGTVRVSNDHQGIEQVRLIMSNGSYFLAFRRVQ